MGGLVGILGEGSVGELESMAARMRYRGKLRAWSPAAGVYFGELSQGSENAGAGESAKRAGSIAIDAAGSNIAIDIAGSTIARAETQAVLAAGGEQAAAAINGFFALAWWDDSRRTLQLICDRNSYKSLYVARLPGRVVFASDCKALLALPEFPASVDRQVLQLYLRSRSFASDRSLLAAATPIGGAYVWSVARDGALTRKPYWQPSRNWQSASRAANPPKPFDEAAIELRGLLQNVMSRQLLDRDRMAIALSGGLDSVAALAIARNVRPEITLASYTVGHSREDPEIVRARQAADHFGTEHHEVFLQPERVPAELARLVWLTEDLTGREEAVLQQVLMQEMAMREREYLAGHGADAAFAGMPRHKLLWLRDHAPPPLRGALDELFTYTQQRTVPRSWLGRWMTDLAYRGDLPELPRVEGANSEPASPRHATLQHYWRETISGRNEGMRFHEPIEASGNLTMVAPFLDPSVVELALGYPMSYHIGARAQKRILRAAVKDLLPEEMSRRGKLIQRLKHDAALSEVLDNFATELRLRESLAARGLVSHEYIAALQKRRSGSAYSSERLHILWAMVCAELWLRQFIDERGAAGPELSNVEAPPPGASSAARFATA